MGIKRALPLLLLAACGAFPSGECVNPNEYRVLALVDGELYEYENARIVCRSWSPGCSASTTTPDPTPDEDSECECWAPALDAEDFRIDFPVSNVGDVVTLPHGQMTITKKKKVPTTCAQGNYYVDYSGVFEGTIDGRTYEHGVFYALEQK